MHLFMLISLSKMKMMMDVVLMKMMMNLYTDGCCPFQSS
jgi:hypothetical protein